MIILTVLLALAYLILLLYYLTGWLKLKVFIPENKVQSQKLSILIPARNEEKNIANLLKDIAKQDFPKELFEVLILNDHSEDQTAIIVEEILRNSEFSNFSFISLPNSLSGKKAAISLGVEQSKNEWIVCTDADCSMNSNWLNTITSFIEKEKPEFISSPVLFNEEATLFEKMQSLEFLSLIGIGASTISHNKPTMCNGANMAFSKKAFQEVGGYAGNENIASGDDEFLMHKIAAKYAGAVKFLKSEEAIVRTHAKKTVNEFWKQRKRWVSKSGRSKSMIEQLMQFFVWIFHLAILSSFVSAFFIPNFWSFFVILYFVKILSELVFVIPLSVFFSKQKFLAYYIISAILYPFYVVLIALAGIFGKNYWKGRRI